MNKNLIVALAASCMTLMTAGAQTQLTTYQPGITAEGMVYYLPKTAVRVSVLVEKTTYTPGDFCRYAQRYLRVSDVSEEPSVAYRVISIDQQAVPVADNKKVYSVKYNTKSIAANATLSDDGRLLGINTPVADDVETPAAFQQAQKEELPNPRLFLTEEILACGSTAKMAELTAREIYDLRENRNLLIKGQADFMPQDGKQMELMLAQLDRQDRSLTSLFCGTTLRDTTEHVVFVTPDGAFSRRVLFRLSQIHGFTDADDLSGTPFYVSIDDLNSAPPVDQEALAAAKPKKKAPESGIYVNVPGSMQAVIYDGITPVSTATHPAPQFGHVELLSGELFNKRYTTHLWLDPLTGAVMKLESDPVK